MLKLITKSINLIFITIQYLEIPDNHGTIQTNAAEFFHFLLTSFQNA